MPFIERLTNETTPKRVFSFLKLVLLQPMSKEEITSYLQPDYIVDSKLLANRVHSFVNNGEFIVETSDGKIQLNMDESEIANMKSFRKAIAKRVFQYPDFMFCRFTSWYMMRGEKVFNETSKALEAAFNNEINSDGSLTNEYNETNITGWRTWAAFLGFGYIHSKILIPNTAVRVKDLLDGAELPQGDSMPFKRFMDWLQTAAPELDGGKISQVNRGNSTYEKQTLSLGLSSGLRSLHDEGVIELNYMSDALDTWYLQKASHTITDKISEITIRGVKK
jgi:hypothetical protein